jgi:hypothetical protein
MRVFGVGICGMTAVLPFLSIFGFDSGLSTIDINLVHHLLWTLRLNRVFVSLCSCRVVPDHTYNEIKARLLFCGVVQSTQRLQKLRSPSASWYLFLRICRPSQTPQPYSLDELCCQICTMVRILDVLYSSCIRSSGFTEMSNLFD